MSNLSLDELRERFISMEPISHVLPLAFKNGARLDKIFVYCADCNGEIEGERMRGRVGWVGEKFILTGLGLCRPCGLVTPFGGAIEAYKSGFCLRGFAPEKDLPITQKNEKNVVSLNRQIDV
jgi:hypothetical protein